jgi:Protein of unknown function with PCYCGC motif
MPRHVRTTTLTRRAMLAATVRAGTAVALGMVTVGADGEARAAGHAHVCRRPARTGGPHPEPRPGIDASHVCPAETVRQHPKSIAAFDEARAIPEILDGIRCHCGCADQEGMRSLLSCYEGEDAMALECDICEGQARLAYRLHGKGRSLDEIRAAIDARYGG